jgi:hypothetical protein
MSQKIFITETPYRSFSAGTAAIFDGAEDTLVQLETTGLIAPYTDGSKPPLGVFVSRLAPESEEVNVRLLGKGGTVRLIQSEPIRTGYRVTADGSTGKVKEAASGDLALGTKLNLGTGEAGAGTTGDIIEVADALSPVS